jgi:hypothetical protein
MRRILSLAGGLAACSLVTATWGAEPSKSVVVDVGACVDIESREQRLECYENLVSQRADEDQARAATDEQSAPDQTETPLAAARAPVSNPDERAEPARSVREASTERAVEPDVEPSEQRGEIVATITSVREVEPDMYMIELDNGEIWRQNAPRRYVLSVGAEVRLRPTRWGPSYRLTDPNRGSFIQVERIR